MSFDVVTLGETLLRLNPPDLDLLERTTVLEARIGGSESNTAVALSRLGLQVTWLSRLPDNPLAARILTELSGHGVDVGSVRRVPGERLGTYYYQPARAPRASRVWYDRADSAMARMRPEDLPDDVFRAGAARLFHTTGITPGIGAAARATALAAMQRARGAGWRVSFDVNHRAALWPPETARPVYEQALALADLVFVAERDVATLWPGYATDWRGLHARCPQALLVVTRGAAGAAARLPDGTVHEQPAITAEVVDRLGRGDAFSAGFLCRWLEDGNAAEALRWGNAAAALKAAIPGDLALIDRREVEELLGAAGGADVRR